MEMVPIQMLLQFLTHKIIQNESAKNITVFKQTNVMSNVFYTLAFGIAN